ncbi:unnamed protein product [Ranitomeya imitator]|uniref:Uncharacterized protein n=1 Tax=Ranitomeya imitator TaxID=111125 RepID=A0ABN9LQG1_9NEOB|nr:unnamed protein product [Ranitomeya imitator]
MTRPVITAKIYEFLMKSQENLGPSKDSMFISSDQCRNMERVIYYSKTQLLAFSQLGTMDF